MFYASAFKIANEINIYILLNKNFEYQKGIKINRPNEKQDSFSFEFNFLYTKLLKE